MSQVRYELRKRGVFDYAIGRQITPKDGPLWAEYHEWLANPKNTPAKQSAPVPPPPKPTDGHNFKAAGKARRARQIAKLAKTDPIKAALMQGGIKQ